jgi:hypothetical protein
MQKGEVKTMDKIIEKLKFFHGDKLNIRDDVYYLFLKDAIVSVYYDDDEKRIKVDIEMLPEENTFVYFSKNSINDLIG